MSRPQRFTIAPKETGVHCPVHGLNRCPHERKHLCVGVHCADADGLTCAVLVRLNPENEKGMSSYCHLKKDHTGPHSDKSGHTRPRTAIRPKGYTQARRDLQYAMQVAEWEFPGIARDALKRIDKK